MKTRNLGRAERSGGSMWNFQIAFTLLEVMIAIAIFFTAMFSILALVSQSLRMARSLSRNVPTPGMAIAQLSLTNKLEEGPYSGDFEDLYPDYDWIADATLFSTNGLFQIDVKVFHKGDVDSSMSTLLYRPDSPTGIGTRSQFR
ncbi:MAG: hypothetical protein ABI042_00080 [Verrucomicrobiota bacterium]